MVCAEHAVIASMWWLRHIMRDRDKKKRILRHSYRGLISKQRYIFSVTERAIPFATVLISVLPTLQTSCYLQ